MKALPHGPQWWTGSTDELEEKGLVPCLAEDQRVWSSNVPSQPRMSFCPTSR